ncbi:asparagine--tRNA ligase [Candidatus Legionella polyplacis]|uniref:asparagine--tRNA ligase n=1 Tax=Candidatus Legionella polyplacis TaxID=2005262 RepID=UPI000C1F1B00|nr:asparagine--tRNA ligase [Candidatus Legionella polyplacis]ATW01651.1 asparagine--tRNA ligase [Candidatus Legionella polyplacis]
MYKTYTIKDCFNKKNKINKIIKINGWIKTKRDSQKKLSFIDLNDGSCIQSIQIVASNNLQNYEKEILKLTTGCSINVIGLLTLSKGKKQNIEIYAKVIKVIGWIKNMEYYPIQAKYHTLQFLRKIPHLRPRTKIISAITRIRHSLSLIIHNYFHKKGYFWINAPIITTNDCEGSSKMFRVSNLDLLKLPKTMDGKINFKKDFFEKETFLTVSTQLNTEAYCLSMSKVYTFGPTFRAENSNTSKHLSEFWMIEPEIAFASLKDICKISKNIILHLCKKILDEREDELKFLNDFIDTKLINKLENIIKFGFEIISYTNCIKILNKSQISFRYPIKWGIDLQTEHERYLTEKIFKKPIIITNYPKQIKSFYMRLNNDNNTVAAMDMIFPNIGEIIGGGQREERIEILDNRIQECGLNKEHYQWYRDLRIYGTVPHAGFGLGFERLISFITGIYNVRDVIPFPRTPGNAYY